MEVWTLREAEFELERLRAMSDEQFRAEILAAGYNPDKAIRDFGFAVEAAIARVRNSES